ncbi:hypothetical protein CRYUN_Cryun21dG0095500 [Craigia yunnanensis]
MSMNLLVFHCYLSKTMIASSSTVAVTSPGCLISNRLRPRTRLSAKVGLLQQRPAARNIHITSWRSSSSTSVWAVKAAASGGVPLPPLDLTEENIKLVLADARVEATCSAFRRFGWHNRTS